MRCAQATVYDNSGSKGPASWLDDRRIRRRLPRLAGRDTGAASRALADAIDRRSSNTTAGTGEGADDDAIPRSAKHTAVTAPIPEAVREITRRWFGDSLDFGDQGRGWRFLKSSAMVSKLAQVTPSWELM